MRIALRSTFGCPKKHITEVTSDFKRLFLTNAGIPLPILHHCQSHNPSLDPVQKDGEVQLLD